MLYYAHSYPIYATPCHQPIYVQPFARSYPMPQYNPDQRQYPDIDSTLFFESAGAFRKLMEDAIIVLDKLSDSKEFAYKVMYAAQHNELEEVERLIKSTGVQGKVDVSYNPNGITLEMASDVEGTQCCTLRMAIRWR